MDDEPEHVYAPGQTQGQIQALFARGELTPTQAAAATMARRQRRPLSVDALVARAVLYACALVGLAWFVASRWPR